MKPSFEPDWATGRGIYTEEEGTGVPCSSLPSVESVSPVYSEPVFVNRRRNRFSDSALDLSLKLGCFLVAVVLGQAARGQGYLLQGLG